MKEFKILPLADIHLNTVSLFYQDKRIQDMHGLAEPLSEDVLSTSFADPTRKDYVVTQKGLAVPLAHVGLLGIQHHLKHATVFLTVPELHHRKGIGSASVIFLEKTAEQLGLRHLFAFVREDNPGAQRLFSLHGFVKSSVIPHYGGVGIPQGVWFLVVSIHVD